MTSPFLEGTKTQLYWDSTSLGWLKTCPRLYQYSMIEGWGSAEESVHLRFGIEYHTALQDYAIARAAGIPHEEALFHVVRALHRHCWDWNPDRANRAGKYKNRETLVALVLDYLDHFVDDPAEQYTLSTGKPAVELSFKFELDWGPTPEAKYFLCGHLDRVVTFQDDLWVMDHKAQPLTTKVLLQDGWTQIKDLTVGDLLAGRDGQFYPILKLFHKGVTPVYEVSFNDKTSVRCADAHLWVVRTASSPLERIMTTTEMIDYLAVHPSVKFAVPIAKAVQHPTADLPVDPYVLGALLGNGYLAGNSIQLSTSDPALIEKVSTRLYGDSIHRASEHNLSWTIKGGCTLQAIKDLNLFGVKSRGKYIPDEYMFADERQRRDLLQGLLDTDGSLYGYHQRYQTISPLLIEDVCALVRSLGGTARYHRKSNGVYTAFLRMPEFHSGIGHRYITAIEEVEPEKTMCIETSAPDGLYLTENYIVTHNTTTSTLSSSYFDQYTPSNQMTLYALAGRVVLGTPVRGVIISAAQILLEKPNAFARSFAYRTEDQLNEFLVDCKYWFAQAQAFAAAGYWPQNDTACHKFSGCAFRDVCSKPTSARETFLRAKFTHHPWNPAEPR